MDLVLELLIVYFIVNVISFILFAADKRKAKMNRRRISERRLLSMAAIGPFGAYAAMKAFRHKTRKTKFILVPLMMVVHIAIVSFLIYKFMI
ncbi:MAG: DUF1294 domain-containing protein [Methanomassiliicoccales archaeon]|nr:DUF1294 domain-containing protein [Methanomassiliicoccales archaeon]